MPLFFFKFRFSCKKAKKNVLKSVVQAFLASRTSVMGVFVKKCDFLLHVARKNLSC